MRVIILLIVAIVGAGCGKPNCHDQYAKFKRGDMSFAEGRELRLFDNDSLTNEQRTELWRAFKYPGEIDLSLGDDTVWVKADFSLHIEPMEFPPDSLPPMYPNLYERLVGPGIDWRPLSPDTDDPRCKKK